MITLNENSTFSHWPAGIVVSLPLSFINLIIFKNYFILNFQLSNNVVDSLWKNFIMKIYMGFAKSHMAQYA